MIIRHILFSSFLFIFLFGCGAVKLTDIPKSSSALQLTNKQKQIIQPKLKLIRDIIDDYDFERRELEGDLREYRAIASDRRLYRYDGGLSTAQRQRNLTQIRTKVRKFLSQRSTSLKEIEKLLREIHAELTAEQRVTFNELKMPELEIPRSLRRDPHAELRRIPRHLIGVH
ncbi:MAG: hypothetical protein OXU23_23095 [Candidatus Poribacteria bacterium]|nr:hypothetical protein [Candidatus Poribacteria bacterium]